MIVQYASLMLMEHSLLARSDLVASRLAEAGALSSGGAWSIMAARYGAVMALGLSLQAVQPMVNSAVCCNVHVVLGCACVSVTPLESVTLCLSASTREDCMQ